MNPFHLLISFSVFYNKPKDYQHEDSSNSRINSAQANYLNINKHSSDGKVHPKSVLFQFLGCIPQATHIY